MYASGKRAGSHFVDRLAAGQFLLKETGQVHRTDGRAEATVDALLRVHVGGPVPHGDGEVSGPTLHPDQVSVGEDLNIGVTVEVQEGRRDRGPRAAVAVVGGAAAEDAVVGGEHIAQLRHTPAQPGQVLHQIDLQAGLGQVYRSAHPANAAADDQDG
jgi:hypothetical protein